MSLHHWYSKLEILDPSFLATPVVVKRAAIASHLPHRWWCGFCLIHTRTSLPDVITHHYYAALWLRSNVRLEFACIHYSADTRLSSFACQLESPGIRLWGYYVMNIGWSLVVV